jgi:hypothetical protein
MEDNGIKTKELLNKYLSKQTTNLKPKKIDENIEDELINTSFGNISDIQLPYEITHHQIYNIENEQIQEDEFCSYILYFIIIIICLGYIGYHLGSEKVISTESINGTTLGLLVGLIIVNLLWSSIKN